MKSRKHLSVVGLYIWYSLQLSQIQTDCLDEERFLLLCKSGDLNGHIQDEKKKNSKKPVPGRFRGTQYQDFCKAVHHSQPYSLQSVVKKGCSHAAFYLPRRGQQDALAGGHCSALGKEKRLCPEPEVCGERQQGAAQPERAGAGGSLLPRRAKGCSRWRANSKQAMRTASKTDSGPVVLLGTGWSWCGFSPVAGEVNRRVTHWE